MIQTKEGEDESSIAEKTVVLRDVPFPKATKGNLYSFFQRVFQNMFETRFSSVDIV